MLRALRCPSEPPIERAVALDYTHECILNIQGTWIADSGMAGYGVSSCALACDMVGTKLIAVVTKKSTSLRQATSGQVRESLQQQQKYNPHDGRTPIS